MKLNRSQLAQVFTNHETLRAFEQALNALDDSIPSNIEDAAVLAASALAVAQTAIASLSILADALAQLEGAPAVVPIVEADDTMPRVQLGTIASQDADNVDISGGSITGMTRNDATGISLTDDTTTNATMYPTFGTAAGTSSLKISSTKLTWNPSTGLLSAPSVSAQFNGTLGLTTPAAAAVTTLSASGQITSTVSTGTAPLVIASTTNIPNLNASSLNGATFASPGAIGGTAPGTGAFTTISASGQITSTLATGTAPFSITSTTVVPNLNVSQLLGGTWAAPGTIGSTTPNTGRFTTVGVGTSSPTYRFVVSNSGAQGIEFDSDGSAYGAGTTGILSYNRSGSAYVALNIDGLSINMRASGTTRFTIDGTGIGFFGATPVAKPTVTGSRGGNAALASLLTSLASEGLITDSTTA